MVGPARAGFTLVEAIVALTISSAIVMMVSTVFLVQNQYYAIQVSRSAAHDNARMMTEVVAGELRSVVRGGVLVAESDSLVVRSPIVMAAVCAHPSGPPVVAVQYDGGGANLNTDEVSGFAVLDTITGDWSSYDIGTWNNINQPGGSPAADCFANGADTVGAYGEFQRFRRLHTYHGSLPAVGQLLMLYRKVVYSIKTSEMDPTKLGLYRAIHGETPVEFASGIDAAAQFQYRTGGSTYADVVAGGSLSDIDAIRIVAEARTSPQTGGVDDVTYGWSVNVILRNGR